MRCVAIVPAYNNQATISETVRALADDDRVDEVIVVDDGSADHTAALAETAGATVLRQGVNRGKHVVLEKGMTEAGEAVLLMVDADTGSSAKAAIALIAPVVADEADMVIGVLPSAGSRGGFGLVKRTAAWMIKAVSGFESVAPMSGQRALSRQVFEACRPFSEGFAVDAMLTAKAARKGFRLLELPVEMTHDHTGRTLTGFLHRGRQGYHVLKAFLPALVRRGIRL